MKMNSDTHTNAKKIGDLHVRKESHMALPLEKNEWHLKETDVNIPCTPGKTYTLAVSVICTSADDEGSRFRQVAKPYLVKGSAFDNKYKTDGSPSNE